MEWFGGDEVIGNKSYPLGRRLEEI